jgi:hypothetical protein
VNITGEGQANGLSNYTFTAVISDSSPDEMGIEIRKPDGSLLLSETTQAITGGTGFAVTIN